MSTRPIPRRSQITCDLCKKPFLGSYKQVRRQRVGECRAYCSKECRTKAKSGLSMEAIKSALTINGKLAPLRGPCVKCGIMFHSVRIKEYCSLDCYYKSDKCKAIGRVSLHKATHAKYGDFPDTIKAVCLNCKQERDEKWGRRNRKFCSKACQRKYYAARFDRWIANPESIALPQCYDEFLNNMTLPCLVSGCSWIGKHLSSHVNFVHGITANKFKELCGFNAGTGLVSMDVHESLSARAQQWTEQPVNAFSSPFSFAARKTDEIRLEGKEHIKKARAMTCAAQPQHSVACVRCDKRFIHTAVGGRRFYCSRKCREHWYGRKHIPMKCDKCGSEFLGTQEQFRNKGNGRGVFCSRTCYYGHTKNVLRKAARR